MPIVIKCTTAEEANDALILHTVLNQLQCNAETDQEMFAKALAAASDRIAQLFTASGPFYAVYHGKTQKAIFRT